ncbi:hypothetical protein AB0L75_42865, partial [Streptomyces sp. NPDC052101]
MITDRSYAVEPWAVRETALDLYVLAQSESVFALSNGHVCRRGNLDEGEPHGLPGSYLNGVHEAHPLPYAESGYGCPESGQTVIDGPSAVGFSVQCDGQLSQQVARRVGGEQRGQGAEEEDRRRGRPQLRGRARLQGRYPAGDGPVGEVQGAGGTGPARGEGGPGQRPGGGAPVADRGRRLLVGPPLHEEADGLAHRSEQRVGRRRERRRRDQRPVPVGEMGALVREEDPPPRHRNARGRLNAERVQQLETLGMVWSHRDVAW